MSTGKFWAIGVGPGDPELVTLKAQRLLAAADVIYHAGPADDAGVALNIVRALLRPGQTIRCLQVAMTRGDDDWRVRYRPAVERIAGDCRQGRQVALITEGDPTLYSTAGYLFELLREQEPASSCEMVPGVTSITAAAARGGMVLTRKDESLAVLPRLYGGQSLDEALRNFTSLALLKLGADWSGVPTCVPEHRPVLYAEAVGTANEFISASREEIARRSPPYFSLLLIGREPPAALEAGGKLRVVGIGPGDPRQMTVAAHEALRGADALVGYSGYLDLLQPLHLPAERFPSALGEEVARADQALRLARSGRRVALVSSGDAGVYGMAGILLERAGSESEPSADATACKQAVARHQGHHQAHQAHNPECDVNVEIVPGVTAALSAAALLGAPLGHDFACISLSDLLTPWEAIERRLLAAAEGDFVVVLYNPVSQRRTWQLPRACELLRRRRAPDTPAGLVDHAYRPEQRVELVTLDSLTTHHAGMTTTIVIGSSRTIVRNGKMITPRGYETV